MFTYEKVFGNVLQTFKCKMSYLTFKYLSQIETIF